MKNLRHLIVVAVLAIACSIGAQAQFRFGVKAGMAINKLSFDESVFDAQNRGGFTGGVMAEFTVPVLNLGFDASVLYAQRSVKISDVSGVSVTDKRSYIDIPVNFKWKMALFGIGNIVAPFITTGPDFSFLCSEQGFNDAWESKKFDIAWNVGAGLQLLNKVQVAASYGFGLTNSASSSLTGFEGKNRSWTVTLAYLF